MSIVRGESVRREEGKEEQESVWGESACEEERLGEREKEDGGECMSSSLSLSLSLSLCVCVCV
jgi:hypothetical protein